MLIGRAPYRVGQLGRALVPWVAARDRALAAALLSPTQYAAFLLMTPTDQRHAARVARALLAEGWRDPDLLVAALLHDLGKVDAVGLGRVRVPHRVGKVLLARYAPRYWQRASARPHRGPLRGYYLLRHHPRLGADWAARLGVSDRSCALIAAHQGDDATDEHGATFARELVSLRAADERS